MGNNLDAIQIKDSIPQLKAKNVINTPYSIQPT